MVLRSVDTVGISAAVEACVIPCNKVDGVIDEGTGAGWCREKNENKVGRLASFSSHDDVLPLLSSRSSFRGGSSRDWRALQSHNGFACYNRGM